MRMIGKTMLVKHHGTPLVTDLKSLAYGSQSCPPLIAFHNNLSNSFSTGLIMSCSHSQEKI
jgi:hypothetical protein